MGADDRQEGGSLGETAARLGAIDRLAAARRIVQLSLGLTAAGLVVLALDYGWRPRSQIGVSVQVMTSLDLAVPAWVPAGRAGRQHGARRCAVDLRPSPRMFRFDPSVARLLIRPAVTEGQCRSLDEVSR
jgi:hypothetical protein